MNLKKKKTNFLEKEQCRKNSNWVHTTYRRVVLYMLETTFIIIVVDKIVCGLIPKDTKLQVKTN